LAGTELFHLASSAKLPKRRQILNEGTYDRAKKTAMPTKVSQNYAIYEMLAGQRVNQKTHLAPVAAKSPGKSFFLLLHNIVLLFPVLCPFSHFVGRINLLTTYATLALSRNITVCLSENGFYAIFNAQINKTFSFLSLL